VAAVLATEAQREAILLVLELRISRQLHRLSVARVLFFP
jgi:hypothetical protein